MPDAAIMSDSIVAAAAGGSSPALARLAAALLPRVRFMVAARLSPTPAQFDAVEDITQAAMLGLAQGVGRLHHRTAAGLNAWMSRIVTHKVADYLAGRGPAAAIGGAETSRR